MSDPDISSMPDPDIAEKMRQDWNARAREDAGFYVACGGREQNEAEFYATATVVINGLETELLRIPKAERGRGRALEVGCGPGRLMRPMSRHFAEIHGVDVSDEMVALAKESLRDISHAHLHVTDGASLREFPDDWFDFVYSYAVFQHIPSREVVFEYLREIHRVLKPGGLARLQLNGLPLGAGNSDDTWSGARFTSTEVMEFTLLRDIQVLALEGVQTQYMWTSWRKQSPGFHATQDQREFSEMPGRIRRISNWFSTEPGAPTRGYYAAISVGVDGLPPEAGLHQLRVAIGDSLGSVFRIGPLNDRLVQDGMQQISVLLPELEATGLLPVELRWLDIPITPPMTLRVIPPGPLVPEIISVSDGAHLVANNRIETRQVKVTMKEIAHPHEIEATVDGHPVMDLGFFCTNPRPRLFEVDFRLPEEIAAGEHELVMRVGRRVLAPVKLEVVV